MYWIRCAGFLNRAETTTARLLSSSPEVPSSSRRITRLTPASPSKLSRFSYSQVRTSAGHCWSDRWQLQHPASTFDPSCSRRPRWSCTHFIAHTLGSIVESIASLDEGFFATFLCPSRRRFYHSYYHTLSAQSPSLVCHVTTTHIV